MRIAMLAPRMVMGYCVAEAVAMQSRQLKAMGHSVAVGCLEYDEHYADLDPTRVAPDSPAVADFASVHGAGVVIAHGSPYLEILPPLTGPFWTIAYEYGEPTPDFFPPDEAAQRRAAAERKRREVYPRVSRVAAISDFVRRDIAWPEAEVIVLGIEHVPDLGPREPRGVGPLRVGTLMRIGSGEARYKGAEEMGRLARELPDLQWRFAGRGTAEDAADLRRAGFGVHLNPSDADRARFLRDEIDVFVTTSQWEGTNLPLVEAQALGTPGLALDTAAHPEFTPLTFPAVADLAEQLRRYQADRSLVDRDGRAAYRYVRDLMSWRDNATALLTLCEGSPATAPRPRARWRRALARFDRVRRAVGEAGLREMLSDQRRRRRARR